MSEESEREAYELRVYERQCFEKQQEETMIDAMNEEAARRLARYDEAVRLLRECGLYTDNAEFDNKVIAFLAAEPKEGEGGQ